MKRPASRFSKPGSHHIAQGEKWGAIKKLLERPNLTFYDYAAVCALAFPVKDLAVWWQLAPPGQLYRLGWFIFGSCSDAAWPDQYAAGLYRQQLAMQEQAGVPMDEMKALEQAFVSHVAHVRDQVRQLIQDRAEDGLFRAENHKLGYGLDIAFQKAETGDQDALLAIVGTFPQAQFDKSRPIITEKLRLLLSSDTGFERNYRLTMDRTLGPDARSKTTQCLFLAMNKEIIQGMAHGIITAPEALKLLKPDGILPAGLRSKSFYQYVRRTFPDLFQPAGSAK